MTVILRHLSTSFLNQLTRACVVLYVYLMYTMPGVHYWCGLLCHAGQWQFHQQLFLFKLPVTFPATRLFHTGRPNGYRSGRALLPQNRRLSLVEELVKLHFSVKATFSLEASVVLCFSYRPQAQKNPGKDFFQKSIKILYNNSTGKKESRLTVLSHHQGLQLKCQSPSKKRIDLRELDSSL